MGTNNLAETYPELAREWHPELNSGLTPYLVNPGSHKKVWWLGDCGHEFNSRISDRASKGSGCPYCSGNRILPGFNDLATTNPELAREWHPDLNGDLKPEQVSPGSNKKVWWLGSCGHEFRQVINNRAGQGQSCPYCSNQKVQAGFNDLATTNPELAREWHPARNSGISAQEVRIGSAKKVWWLGSCGHEWQANPGSRKKGQNCPYCSGRRSLEGFNDLATTHPLLASEWHPKLNGELKPEQVSAGSTRQVWWLGSCGHEWRAHSNSRTSNNTGCPVCSGKRMLVGFNDIATTHPLLASEWHPTKNGQLTPEQLTAGVAKRVWWLGSCGHEWQAILNNRTGNQAGCPKCSRAGFSSADPGLIYFIHNPGLRAFKVGITNPIAKSNRLDRFGSKGWNLIRTWESDSGRIILDCETQFFRWLRKEIKAPIMLQNSDMGYHAGASETFSDSILNEIEIMRKIEELLAEAQR